MSRAVHYLLDVADSDDQLAAARTLAHGGRVDAWQRDGLLEAVRASVPLSGRRDERDAAAALLAAHDALPVRDARTGALLDAGGPLTGRQPVAQTGRSSA